MSGVDGGAMLPGRIAAGMAGNALDGRFPSPSMGAAVASSYAVNEHWLGDFLKAVPISAYSYRVTDIGGGCTPTPSNPVAATERGILQLATGPTILDGGTIALPQPTFSGPDAGTLYACKVRISGTQTQLIAWSGFSSGLGSTPAVATAMSFVGIRAISAGAVAHWFGVSKDGASSEETVDLGVDADGTWRIFAFRVLESSTVFYSGNASDRDRGVVWTPKGSTSTHRPTAALYPVPMGLLTTNGAQKELEQDFWSIGGGVAS